MVSRGCSKIGGRDHSLCVCDINHMMGHVYVEYYIHIYICIMYIYVLILCYKYTYIYIYIYILMHSTRSAQEEKPHNLHVLCTCFPQVARELAARETRYLLQVNDFQRKHKRQAQIIRLACLDMF